jgi:ketosteroid isomerase-like protein
VDEQRLPAVAVVISFIDRVNHGDAEGLGRLMTDDHSLEVLDEPPVRGRDANIEAWRGYLGSFPAYVIYPRRIAARGGEVAVLGQTTGSHLGLPDEEEFKLTVIWVATAVDGRLSRWRVADDAPDLRRRLGLDDV